MEPTKTIEVAFPTVSVTNITTFIKAVKIFSQNLYSSSYRKYGFYAASLIIRWCDRKKLEAFDKNFCKRTNRNIGNFWLVMMMGIFIRVYLEILD